jgi:hypothetical protein
MHLLHLQSVFPLQFDLHYFIEEFQSAKLYFQVSQAFKVVTLSIKAVDSQHNEGSIFLQNVSINNLAGLHNNT